MRVFLRAGGVELERDVTAFRDFQGRVAGPGHVGEDFPHLLGGLEIDFRGVMHPVLVDDQMPGADADHHVMRFVIVFVQEVHVIRGDDLEIHLPGKFQ